MARASVLTFFIMIAHPLSNLWGTGWSNTGDEARGMTGMMLDTALLTVIYCVYLYFLNKIPPQDEEKTEDMDRLPRLILRQRRAIRNSIIVGLFVSGGMILYFTAHPFLDSLKAIAVGLGLTFIQKARDEKP